MILKGKKIPACIFVAAAIFDDAVFSHLKEEKINTTFLKKNSDGHQEITKLSTTYIHILYKK